MQRSSHGCYRVSVRFLKGFLKGCHKEFYNDAKGIQIDYKGFLQKIKGFLREFYGDSIGF